MRAWMVPALLLAACNGILGIPSETTAICEDECVVTVSGVVRPIDTPNAMPRPNVRIRLTSVPDSQPRTSDASGNYSLADLDLSTALEVELSYDQSNPTVMANILSTRFLGPTAIADMTH
jgi:hypothetical protein